MSRESEILEEAKLASDAMKAIGRHDFSHLIDRLLSENERLERQNADLIADGERLDWLEDHVTTAIVCVRGTEHELYQVGSFTGESLRQAIDDRRK